MTYFNPDKPHNPHADRVLGAHGRGPGVCIHRPVCDQCRADQLQEIVRELHACLYPERYYSAEELAQSGIEIVDGVYQWDADTLDALADVFKRRAAELAGVVEPPSR